MHGVATDLGADGLDVVRQLAPDDEHGAAEGLVHQADVDLAVEDEDADRLHRAQPVPEQVAAVLAQGILDLRLREAIGGRKRSRCMAFRNSSDSNERSSRICDWRRLSRRLPRHSKAANRRPLTSATMVRTSTSPASWSISVPCVVRPPRSHALAAVSGEDTPM
jgi:hypothetical protein